jgi:ubiquinol-cytochrome c reductase cytochrome b subunit
VRTALGAAAITFFTVLWAGTWISESTPAMRSAPGLPPPPPGPDPLLTAPHETYLWWMYGLRIALFVLPPIAYALTLAWCRGRR